MFLLSKLLPDAMTGSTAQAVQNIHLICVFLNSALLWPTLNMIREVPCSFTARSQYLKKIGNNQRTPKINHLWLLKYLRVKMSFFEISHILISSVFQKEMEKI